MNEHRDTGQKGHKPAPLTPAEIIIDLLAGILVELMELNAKEAKVVQQITNLEDAIARIEDDAKNVADNTAATKTLVGQLQQEVADLTAQLANGVPITADQVQGFADRLDAVDTALDTIAPPITPPAETPPV